MLDVQPPPDTGSIVQQIARQFASLIMTALAIVNSTVADLAGLAYVPVMFVGILLDFTQIGRRLGGA